MLTCAGLVLSGSPPPTIQATPGQVSSQLGMNLNSVVSYTSQWPFADAFKITRPWISGRPGAAFSEGGPLKLTADGWVAALEPNQFAETVLFEDTKAHYPQGQYLLLYDGEGEIQFNFDSARILQQQPGRMVLQVIPQDTGIWLQIRATNPQNPLRNLRLILPGLEKTYQRQPFHPLFLERLRPFKTIRFMDWMQTNSSTLQNWANRPRPEDPSQGAGKGVALEYMIDLANTLQANPWFTLPHRATDDYVRQFATLVRDRLDPNLKIYIEYSNEVWNTAPAFNQSKYAEQQGLALGLAEDPYLALLRYYSQRSVEVFKIWETVFGSTDPGAVANPRLIRVLAGQYANPWTSEQILTWKNAYQQADAYAIAPYFSGDWDTAEQLPQLLNSSEAQIFEKMAAEIRSYGPYLQKNYSRVRSQFGLDLIAYEGGQHLVSSSFGDQEPAMTTLFTRLNRHPRMGELYSQYLQQWQASGGGLLCHFVDVSPYTQHGSWGALEYQDQPLATAPKYQALLNFIQRQTASPATLHHR
ncbi:MAG: hypothetical protein HC934_10945 [Acaryochloridaceae cyanobacterium SU_2_1]|nr:hypothetical protein [Acaryochloridaceae cyanobacterium SU_2_1]